MEIKIGKAARLCSDSEAEFEHGQTVISLVRIENQEYIREDYSEKSWNADAGSSAIAVWTTTFIDPRVADQEPPESFSPLRRTFYDAAEAKDRSELAVAYLAAELLRRQKVFRRIKESDDPEGEARIALYADRLGDRLVEVRDPDLSLGELESGRSMLMERLRELEDPTDEEDTADEAVDTEDVDSTDEVEENVDEDEIDDDEDMDEVDAAGEEDATDEEEASHAQAEEI
jgi:hypothetical protein